MGRVRETWPILPGSERPPQGWPGWPENKKFAFVLTHDVEGESGVAKCLQLMEVEKKWGFRSSFNFIPEGEYRVSKALRDELTANGFEVGVHDLNHDGKLYQSREGFVRKAARINGYLKEWGAVGFRSGFMLHNLEWLEDLDALYDASTFDTDPFEPQPDAAETIYPFWKAGANGRGYVELPYTLAQDSTLYLLMGERAPAIWMQKAAWVVEQGGMVLLNLHPDYLAFSGESPTFRTFPVSIYEDFLKHIREKFDKLMWHGLPREIAAWYKETCVTPGKARVAAQPITAPAAAPPPAPAHNGALKARRVAVVLYACYLLDQRPRREAEALVREGMEVEVISLEENSSMPREEMIDGVKVFRAPLGSRRTKSKRAYIFRYGAFFLYSLYFLTRRGLKSRYDVVHVHNMPDFLVFAAVTPRCQGARIILDLHDPMPELFQGIYRTPPDSFSIRLLQRVEKASIAFADLVLTPNIAFKDVFVSRGSRADKIEIVMNSPQEDIYDSTRFPGGAQNRGAAGSFTLMFHGLLVERHGLDLAVQAVAKLRPRLPGLVLHLYGEQTEYVAEILDLVRKLGLQDAVEYRGCKTQPEIAQIISTIDLGLIPNRLNAFTNINFPTRIFEYLAMNKPVLMTRTKGVRDYFAEDELLYVDVDKADALAEKIEWACRHPAELRQLVEKGRKVLDQHSWTREGAHFTGLVNNMLAGDARWRASRAAELPS
jgi:glycosyltransferase involved in cell wall biosynthesis